VNWKGSTLTILKRGFAGGILFWLFDEVNVPHAWVCMKEVYLAPILISILLTEMAVLIAACDDSNCSRFSNQGMFRCPLLYYLDQAVPHDLSA
jgi:hypothetical protein